jgi:peptide/nickel transport system substrate-binding protein
MRWKKWAVLASVAALGTAGACGGAPAERAGGGTDPTEKERDTSSIAELTDPNAQAPAADVPGAQEGGTLTVVSGVAPSTLDPTRAYYVDATAIMSLVTRSLTQYKYEDGHMVLVPDLATDLGQPNEDFTEWKFTLRDGLKYDDGTPVKAEDVAYAIKRQFATDELPDGPLYGLDYFVDGDTYKGPFKSAKQGGGDDFAGVSVEGNSVTVHMRRPFPDMSFYTAFPNFSPIPQAKDTGPDYEQDPMATGPYKFEKYTEGKELILVKNDQWDPNTDPARHQYLDGYHFKFAQDQTVVEKAMMEDNGPEQTTLSYDDILGENYPDIQADPTIKERLVEGRESCVSYAFLDTRNIPLEVRRAIAVAYPHESVNKVNGTIPGLTWYPSTSILASIAPGYVKSDAAGTGGEGDGDPVRAKKMLEEAGELGFELAWFVVQNDPLAPKVSGVRKQAFEESGFKVKEVPTTEEKLREDLSDPNAPVNMRFQGWCLDWFSGSSVFPAQWNPKNVDVAGVPNPSFLKDAELQRRIDEILDMPYEDAQVEWGKLDKWLMEEHQPIVSLGEGGEANLRGSKVQNVHIGEVLGMPVFHDIYLEQ